MTKTILIAHRGNIDGPSPSENSPEHIQRAIDRGFDVEADVWYLGQDWYLGHDRPQYRIDSVGQWPATRMWWHAKDPLTALALTDLGFHAFSHDKDPWTITSLGVAWFYPNTDIPEAIRDQSVQVLPELSPKWPKAWMFPGIYGVCSDFVGAM